MACEHLDALESQEDALLGREPQVPVNSLLGLAKKLAGAAVLAIACALVLLSWDTAKNDSLKAESIGPAHLREMQVTVATPFALWQSAEWTGEKLTKKPDGKFGEDFQFAGPEVVVTNKAEQIIEGFGGAFTESAATVYGKLSAEQKTQFLEDYFHVSGLGYVLGRTHINSCHFSISSYSFDDYDGDVELTNFDNSVERDKQQLLPMIWAAQYMVRSQGQELKMLASPWSPPAWMKNQTWSSASKMTMDHSGSPCLKPGMERVWANYIAKWIEAYQAHGVPIWGLTVQNEPLNNATWEACYMTSEVQAHFVAHHLGPVIRATAPGVQIFLYDHNKDKVYDYAMDILKNSEAGQYVAGVAIHWYSGDHWQEIDRLQGELQRTNLKLLPSEATWEAYRWRKGTVLSTGDWSFGEGYAHDIIGDLNRGAVGWLDWNLLLDETGGPNHVGNVCDAAIQANLTAKEVYRHPQYYYIGHFSKFFSPGSLHLQSSVLRGGGGQPMGRPYGTCTAEDGLEATAARRPNGQVAVVVLNCGDRDVEYKLKYTTMAAKLKIPAHGIQTLLFEEMADI